MPQALLPAIPKPESSAHTRRSKRRPYRRRALKAQVKCRPYGRHFKRSGEKLALGELGSAAYADFRPITGPNRFTVRLTARPAYPDARSRTLRALMKELGLSREQGIRLLEQARREPVPLREGLTEEEALALLEVFRRAGAPVQLVDGAVPEPPQLPSPVPGDALTFTSVVFATLTALVIWSLLSLLFTSLFG